MSPRDLSGPIAIVTISYDQARTGLAEFLLFLGMISLNLAVLISGGGTVVSSVPATLTPDQVLMIETSFDLILEIS